MYCQKCGEEIQKGSSFCTGCGARIELDLNKNKTVQTADMAQKTKKKTVLLVLLFVSAIIIIGGAILLLSGNGGTSFQIKYDASSVGDFLARVCKNVDAEYAKVLDPDYDSPAGNSLIASQIEIKPAGKTAKKIQMRFHNEGDSDTVSWGEIIFYDDDREVEFECKRLFIHALEETLAGEVKAGQYIINSHNAEAVALNIDHLETRQIADYWLTDNLRVVIEAEHSFGFDWYWRYKIYNSEQ